MSRERQTGLNLRDPQQGGSVADCWCFKIWTSQRDNIIIGNLKISLEILNILA